MKVSNFFIIFTLFVTLSFVSLGCGEFEPDSDQRQRQETERMTTEAHTQVGMPGITNFTERKFAKQIYELRDKEVTTFTYYIDMNGNKHFICESIGYGLPYSVQYVSPEKIAYRSSTYGTGILPQAEPNGLFMPDGLAATWILCSDGEGGIRPVYSEPELLVSPFPLQ